LSSEDIKDKSAPSTEQGKGSLGTFGGVFTPSILTILGVIMYLRFGWVVGNVGLIGTLIIVTLSTSITFLTALSIASISTDKKVKTGGAYYMISRSLGIESGGAVGIPLFIAQTLSIALYTVGFAESFVDVFPFFNEKYVGLIVTIIIGVVALTSPGVAIKFQYFIMAAIGLSLISLVFGSPLETTHVEMWGVKRQESENFWKVFAIFFPAVTGIMAGVSMSGDLKDPGKSIPKGTLLAVGAGYLIYMILPVILAGRADAETLINDPLIMRKISFWGDAILLGVWGATLSSALGSILGAPRVLQALARDNVLPGFLHWLGKGSGANDSPRYGTVFVLLVSMLAVYFGNLDLIAPVLTMFFLATYGVLNISSAIENFLKNPSFRPTFQISWIFSFAGAIGCVVVMLLINPLATVMAVVFVLLTYVWLESRRLNSNWGDVWQGVWMALSRGALLRLKVTSEPKNWYPHLLVLSGAPTKRWYLIALSHDIVQNKGLMTVASVLKKSDAVDLDRQKKMENNVKEFLLDKGINCLVRIISDADPYEGGKRLVEVYGIGSLYPNTVVLGMTTDWDHMPDYSAMIAKFYEAKRNVLIIRDNDRWKFVSKTRIDIWWAGLKGNGALMILLAYQMKKSYNWRQTEIILNIVTKDEEAGKTAGQNLKELAESMRIPAKSRILTAEGRPFFDLLKEKSASADLVILGLAKPTENYDQYLGDFLQKTEGLPTTMYVLAGEDIAFDQVLK